MLPLIHKIYCFVNQARQAFLLKLEGAGYSFLCLLVYPNAARIQDTLEFGIWKEIEWNDIMYDGDMFDINIIR